MCLLVLSDLGEWDLYSLAISRLALCSHGYSAACLALSEEWKSEGTPPRFSTFPTDCRSTSQAEVTIFFQAWFWNIVWFSPKFNNSTFIDNCKRRENGELQAKKYHYQRKGGTIAQEGSPPLFL